MTLFNKTLDGIGALIADRLERPCSGYEPFTPSDPVTLNKTLKIADVLLVEGNQKVGAAIKYLTQSTWSHAALFVGNMTGSYTESGEPLALIEANLGEGVVAVAVSKYRTFNTRICRAVSLSEAERKAVAQFAIDHIGDKYDTRNVLDLARYLIPTPPIPIRWRRRMIAMGSGEPTRTICSTLIAQAFQNVLYPILPDIEQLAHQRYAASKYSREEILHIRHHSLFAPRDFDLSPFFKIVKPTIECGFDHHSLRWASDDKGLEDLEKP